MHIGFTGTRLGMTKAQEMQFSIMIGKYYNDIIDENEIDYFHHGDCVGSDAKAHEIIQKLFPHVKIHVHPPIQDYKRAFCQGAAIIKEPQSHFARNRNIVDECEVLFATPLHDTPMTTGGTWYTINYARKKLKDIIIVWPNGTVKEEYR